jgi:DNA repair protein SbcD/Mre11
MEVKPIGILSSDWHIDKSNHSEVREIIYQKIELVKEMGLSKMYVLGDIFESRVAQPLTNLQFFKSILDKCEESGIAIIAIPGNHDKINYESKLSYLDIFSQHPALTVVDEYKCIVEDNINIHLIPYFKEDTVYSNYLKNIVLSTNQKNILLTHIGLDGVSNNDGVYIKGHIKKEVFSKLDSVFIGHYHNRSQYGDNIHYIGSIKPNNFGEDNDKGFTILFSDCSFEYIQAGFKEYKTIEIDIDTLTKKEVDLLTDKYKDKESKVRVVLKGSETKLKAVDVSKFIESGITVKRVNKDLERGVVQSIKGEFITFNKEEIVKEFNQYCEDRKIQSKDYGYGKLLQILNIGR